MVVPALCVCGAGVLFPLCGPAVRSQTEEQQNLMHAVSYFIFLLTGLETFGYLEHQSTVTCLKHGRVYKRRVCEPPGQPCEYFHVGLHGIYLTAAVSGSL